MTIGFETSTLMLSENVSSALVCIEVLNGGIAFDVEVEVFTMEGTAMSKRDLY